MGFWVLGGADFCVILLLTLIASSPIRPRLSLLSTVMDSISGGGFDCDFFTCLRSVLLDLSFFRTLGGSGEFISNLSGFLTCPTVLAVIRVPEGGGGGFGLEEPPVVITTSAGGGADEVDCPFIICVMYCCWFTL